MLNRLEQLAVRAFAGQRARWLAPALLVLAFGASLSYGLGRVPVTRRAEDRCRDVTQRMVATGDWLVPYQDGKPRLHKPPLYYWAAAATSRLAGGTSLWTLRLPAALCALALVLLAYSWGRELGGVRLGLMAAMLLVAMEQMFALGRRGVAEMSLALFCNLALLCFDRLHRSGRRGLLPWFALWVALAALSKASMALLVIGLPIAVLLWRVGGLRRTLRPGALVWPALGVSVCLAWYLAVMARVPGGWETIASEALLPLGVDMPAGPSTAAHYRPPWFYFKEILAGGFPAILLFPIGVWQARRTRFWKEQPRLRFLALMFATLFVALSILPQKQRHYLLPLLPGLAILMAHSLLALHDEAPERFGRMMTGLGWGLCAFALPVAGLLAYFYGVVLSAGPFVWGGLLVGGPSLAFVALAAARRRHRRVFALTCLVGVLSLSTVYFGSVSAWREHWRRGTLTGLSVQEMARWERLFEQQPLVERFFHPHPSLRSASAVPAAAASHQRQGEAGGESRQPR